MCLLGHFWYGIVASKISSVKYEVKPATWNANLFVYDPRMIHFYVVNIGFLIWLLLNEGPPKRFYLVETLIPKLSFQIQNTPSIANHNPDRKNSPSGSW